MPAVQLQRSLSTDDGWTRPNIKPELRVRPVETETDKVSTVIRAFLALVPVLAVVEEDAIRGLRTEGQEDVQVKVDITQGLEAHVGVGVLWEVGHESCNTALGMIGWFVGSEFYTGEEDQS